MYAAVMLWLLFGQRMDREFVGTYLQQLRCNLIPFETIWRFAKIIVTGYPDDVIPHAWQNLIGNVVMFMPIGACLPCFFERCRRLRTIFPIGLLIVAGIEFTQFFSLLGSLDFDDFMLNMIGICLGYAVWRFCFEKLPKICINKKD